MKISNLRAGVALACALGLSACGGSGSGQLVLGGSLYGVTKDGLKLQNNGGSDLDVPAGTYFQFPDLIPIDASYNVTVKAIPSNAEKCEVSNGIGRAVYDVMTIGITCTLKKHTVSGTVAGLGNASGLVLVNGSVRLPIDPGKTTFAMTDVGEDTPYGITVLTSPAGLVCTVTNGVGTMLTADINNVAINCAKGHALGGTITGLGDATGLELINGTDKITVDKGATTFAMPMVGENSPYNVRVRTNPTGLSCTVTNGVGTMQTNDISNVSISCVAVPAA
ncbi:hypothetical protein [Massilia horti]|uniref:Lipoprotein n=1 Tax=Massilia horti TaxID=2562153 RepID=A0A4Y9SZM8_9BURK|nr:hypothetical protein [Massilia horti]TFW32157.1 hypothetical protein E4O92_10785 [Massilia horti]